MPTPSKKGVAAKGAVSAAPAVAVNPFLGRAFAYGWEMATGQVVSRGDSMCRDRHPYHVRADYLAANPGKSCVLLWVNEIPLADYDALLSVLEAEAGGNANG